MAELSFIERRKLEKLLDMGSGYVLNFTNPTFADFVADSVQRQIFDGTYEKGTGSKANRLRAFWEREPSPLVAKLLHDLFNYIESERHEFSEDVQEEKHRLLPECRKIVERLRQASPELDALAHPGAAPDLEVVARAVRDHIEKNELAAGLDRLHTFAMKFIRGLCERQGVPIDRSKALHSVFGEYVRKLHEHGHLQSKMTASILKSMRQPFEDFNEVRNKQSLAHDNELLNHDEALLIFNHVTSSLRFLRNLEARLAKPPERRCDSCNKSSPTSDWRDDDCPLCGAWEMPF